jgi:RraA family protein
MGASVAMLGPALTVRTRPGDNLMVQKSLDLAQPGDVIVVDAGGELAGAIVGEIMSNYAVMRGIAGIVVYGAVRDLAALRAGTLPVYALGATPHGPDREGWGQINVALNLNGMIVEPGDVMLGDADGVVCVPFNIAHSIAEAARARQVAEDALVARMRAGHAPDRGWIDAAITQSNT